MVVGFREILPALAMGGRRIGFDAIGPERLRSVRDSSPDRCISFVSPTPLAVAMNLVKTVTKSGRLPGNVASKPEFRGARTQLF